jgi:catechol 2,3-dioxygenase-like lactoylglutathione lyase family enzyme
MIRVKRLGHATLTTPDLDQQIAYWTEVIGLSVVDRGKDNCFLATRLGQECIALERSSERGELRRLSFQAKPESDLDELASKLQSSGVQSERRQDISPGVREAIVFRDPKGTLIEVYADYMFAPEGPPDSGISPVKFGHIAYYVADVQKTTNFYCDILGFRISDWIGDYFSFLRCGVDHHTVNFRQAEHQTLSHIAFELRDRTALNDASDYLAKKKIQLVWGPLRNIVGHNMASYHRNPDDVRVELFAEMDLMKDEELGYWEPRPWHEKFPLKPQVWDKSTWRSAWGFGSFGNIPDRPFVPEPGQEVNTGRPL